MKEEELKKDRLARQKALEKMHTDRLKSIFTELFEDVQFIGDEIASVELRRVFGITKMTAMRHLETHREELEGHGYRVVTGEELHLIKEQQGNIDVTLSIGSNAKAIALFTLPAAFAFGMSLNKPSGALLRSAMIELVKELTDTQQSHAMVRLSGKHERRTLTDAIKFQQWLTKNDRNYWYATFTKLMYKHAGVTPEEWGNRDLLTEEQLRRVQKVEGIAASVVVSTRHEYMGEVYQELKQFLEAIKSAL